MPPAPRAWQRNGQTSGPHIFSVAQHSILVEAIAAAVEPGIPISWRLALLLHDAPEYVVGDIISPFKAVIGEAYRTVEERVLAAIHLRFGLPAVAAAPLARLTKQADRSAAFLEATHLAGFSRPEALKVFGRPSLVPDGAEALLDPWPSETAERRFRDRFEALGAA